MNTIKKGMNKVCAIMIIIALTISDFIIVGSSVVSYAIDTIKTNNSNVDFSAYFINEDEEKVEELGAYIDDEEVYLYVDVSVYNDGYFNGTIKLENSNFKIKDEILCTGVSEISEDTVTLNQINAGSTETIKLAIEPKTDDTISREYLVTETDIVLEGEYVNSKNIEKNKYTEISGTANVTLTWKSSEETEAELDAKLLTNSIYEINEEEKRIVQILVNSRITNNNYPVYSTSVELSVPENVESISVSARSTDATNSSIEFGTDNYSYNEEEKTVNITVSNSDTENISWYKDCYDAFVVTYVFDVNEYIAEDSIEVNSTITTYDSKELTQNQSVHIEETENIDGVISYTVSTEETSIYKGKIYTGEDREYKVTNEINVNYLNVVDSIKLNCNAATYMAGDKEGAANIVYTKTVINKQNFIDIFGEDGSLTIKNENGTTVATINNDTEADEDGNIVISYNEETKSIEIETSEPIKIGTLEVENTKTIKDAGYSRSTISSMTAIKESVTGTDNESETTAEQQIELKETETVASLNLDTTTISTTADSQTITICAVLKADDESKDLYKNPTVTITLPEEIKVTNGQIAILYGNGLSIADKNITQNSNGNYQITVQLEGEQTSYDSDSTSGARIYVKLDIETSVLTPSKTDTIELTYTNEYKNVTNTTSREITFESQYGLMVYSQLSNYNSNGETITSLDSEEGTLTVNSEDQDVTWGTAIINNYGDTITDVTVIGTIPAGEGDDTFESTLNTIVTDSSKATVTYSEDPDATADDDSWGEYTENAVSYKIEVSEMEAEEVIKVSATSTISDEIGYAEQGSYTTETECTYLGTVKSSSSSLILATKANMSESTTGSAITTTTDSNVDVSISAYIGNDGITADDEVYEGQTIRYEITVTNNSETDYSNVTVKVNQTNGYVWDDVTKERENPFFAGTDYEYYDEDFYQITDSSEIELGTIENLKSGESYSFEYEAVANLLENISGTETYGTISITSEDEELEEETTTIKNIIKDAEIQAKIIDGFTSDITYVSGEIVKGSLEITNITKETLSNVEVQVAFSSDLNAQLTLDDDGISTTNVEETSEGITICTLKIDTLEAGETKEVYLDPNTDSTLDEDQIEVWMLSEVTTESGNNYISNKLTRKVSNKDVDIELNSIGYKDGTKIDTENDVISDGDTVQFVTTIENNEESELTINITYQIDSNITITSAEISTNGESADIKDKFRSNTYTNYSYTIDEGEKITITVEGTIDAYEIETITNNLTVMEYPAYVYKYSPYALSVNKVSEDDLSEDDLSEDDTESTYTYEVYKTEKDEDDDYDETQYVPSSKSNSSSEVDEDEIGATSSKTDNETNNSSENNEEQQGSSSEENNEGNQTENNTEEEQGSSSEENENNTEEEQGSLSENNTEEEQESLTEVTNTTTSKNKYTISGTAWLDEDKNGIRSSSEDTVSNMSVVALNVDTQEVTSTTTNSKGKYSFTLEEGNYIIVFEYDNELYTTTTYQVSGASDSENSDAIGREVTINGSTITAGTTDTISLTQNMSNIDVGIIQRNTFDLSIAKYVSKITVNNDAGVDTSEQSSKTTLAKTEIKSKYLSGSVVVIEYTLAITNVGDVAGYAVNIVDNLPSTLEFNSSLNSDWYLSDGKLYNTSLANTLIEPGETKEITLVLTKTMTETNTGLINNTAQITESSNSLGLEDETDNKGSANVIISVSTGTAISYGLITITTLVILAGIAYVVNKKYLSKLI